MILLFFIASFFTGYLSRDWVETGDNYTLVLALVALIFTVIFFLMLLMEGMV